MSETMRRWYLVRYESKEDPSLGIDYTFGEKAAESAFFQTEQGAYAILSLMTQGITFTLMDGQQRTIYEFGVEKVDDNKYAICSEHEIPMNLMASVRPVEPAPLP